MTKDEKIESEYTKIFKNLYFTDYQKGIDEEGWYSNERNDRWLPILQEIPLFDFRNNNTEIRPKSLQRIEDNNGWMKISEVGYPTDETVNYHVIDIAFPEVQEIALMQEVDKRFTHWRIIPNPLNPLY